MPIVLCDCCSSTPPLPDCCSVPPPAVTMNAAGYEADTYAYVTSQTLSTNISGHPAWIHFYHYSGTITSPGPGQTNDIAMIETCDGAQFNNPCDCDPYSTPAPCNCGSAFLYPGTGQGNITAFFMAPPPSPPTCCTAIYGSLGLSTHIDIPPSGADDSHCVWLDNGNVDLTWDPATDWIFMVPSLVSAGAVIANYQGLWSAATNTPTLGATPTGPQDGYFWLASDNGTWATLSFSKGDFIMAVGGEWVKMDGVLFTKGCQSGLCSTVLFTLTDCATSDVFYGVFPTTGDIPESGDVIQINGFSSVCYTVGDYTPDTAPKTWIWIDSLVDVGDCDACDSGACTPDMGGYYTYVVAFCASPSTPIGYLYTTTLFSIGDVVIDSVSGPPPKYLILSCNDAMGLPIIPEINPWAFFSVGC